MPNVDLQEEEKRHINLHVELWAVVFVNKRLELVSI